MNMKYGMYLCLFVLFSVAFVPAQNSNATDDQPNIQPGSSRSVSSSKNKLPSVAQQPSQDSSSGQGANPQPNENAGQVTGTGQAEGAIQGESSSRDSQVDFHNQPIPKTPANSAAVEYPFDPHKAAKDVEVGNFYFSRKNYRAALDRFQEALRYKPNDAEGTYELARTLEKMDLLTQAYQSYNKYLEILPEGPSAKDSREAIKRLEPRLNTSYPEPEKQAVHDIEAGEILLSRNNFAAAQEYFEHALRVSPENPMVYLRLAQSLQGLQRLDEARLYYRKYIELQPDGKYVAEAKRAVNDINLFLGK